MSSDGARDDARRHADFLRRSRWADVAGCVAIAALIGAGAVSPSPWRWRLFWWGVAIGLAWIVENQLLIRTAMRRAHASSERRARAAIRLRHTARSALITGLMIGSAAAALDLIAFGIAVTILAGLMWLLDWILLLTFVRRSGHRAPPVE